MFLRCITVILIKLFKLCLYENIGYKNKLLNKKGTVIHYLLKQKSVFIVTGAL